MFYTIRMQQCLKILVKQIRIKWTILYVLSFDNNIYYYAMQIGFYVS